MLLRDGWTAFFSAVGMATLVWLAVGLVFRSRRSVPGLRLVLPLTGEAPAMEQDVRTLRRLQAQLPGTLIVLEDRGLTPEALALARYLVDREAYAVLITDETGDRIP